MARRDIYDRGTGPPLIVIPGVQGRYEWMLPTLDALSRSFRTISYSLYGASRTDGAFDRAAGFANFIRQLDDVYARTGVTRAAVCGVSFGGFVALRYAALRPERVSALLLVSAPSPGWVPSTRQQRQLAHPIAGFPGFFAGAAARFWRELRTAIPSWNRRVQFSVAHGLRVVRAPMIPTAAAYRVAAQQAEDLCPDCTRIVAPTLVVAGEDGLDLVVPPEITQRYVNMIPGARFARLEHTGHLGIVTRPDRFVHLVDDFVHAHDH